MQDPEYIHIGNKYFPEDIRHRYNLDSKLASDGYTHIKIKKGGSTIDSTSCPV